MFIGTIPKIEFLEYNHPNGQYQNDIKVIQQMDGTAIRTPDAGSICKGIFYTVRSAFIQNLFVFRMSEMSCQYKIFSPHFCMKKSKMQHICYTSKNEVERLKPQNPADAIIAVMGDGNQCELLTLGNSRRVSLKLGRA